LILKAEAVNHQAPDEIVALTYSRSLQKTAWGTSETLQYSPDQLIASEHNHNPNFEVGLGYTRVKNQ
jgi:hypothetical protein